MEIIGLVAIPFAVSRSLLIEDFSQGTSCNMGRETRCKWGEVKVGFVFLHILLLPVLGDLTSNTWSLEISHVGSCSKWDDRGSFDLGFPQS